VKFDIIYKLELHIEQAMDIGPEKHHYGNNYSNTSGRGLKLFIAVALILTCSILWISVYHDFQSYESNMTFIYAKAFIGSFLLLLGIAGITSIQSN
jgi:hypothetical protein